MGVNQDTKSIVDAFRTDGKTKNNTYQAEVTKIDNEGVVWVSVAGSDIETPTEAVASEVKRGDSVNVEWRNNKLYIAGNYSDPSAGVQRVHVVEDTANAARETAEAVNGIATQAATDAAAARQIAGNTNQYFWHTETGTDTGAHITEIPKDDFISQTQIDPTSGGGNLLARSNGLAVRDGLIELATFGASGAQIGRTGAAHSVIDADGQRFYASDGTTQLANIGYGEGAAQSGTAIAPYYFFGEYNGALDPGNYSISIGSQVCANGYASQSCGYNTIASGFASHAEGEGTPDVLAAIGRASHAEGRGVGATGDYSHAEGLYTGAAGQGSHAQNTGTYARGKSQTVIGEYNELQGTPDSRVNTDCAFVIGNGTSDNSRSNALTVDWSGNLTAAGDITDGTGNVLSNKADASSVVTPDDYVTSHGTSGSWRYRKWHSGKIEAWFEGTFSCAASTTARGALYYSTWSLTIPNAIGFTATPNTLIGNTGDSNTVIAVNGAATSTTAISGKVWRYASSSSALTISAKIYAWQN